MESNVIEKIDSKIDKGMMILFWIFALVSLVAGIVSGMTHCYLIALASAVLYRVLRKETKK